MKVRTRRRFLRQILLSRDPSVHLRIERFDPAQLRAASRKGSTLAGLCTISIGKPQVRELVGAKHRSFKERLRLRPRFAFEASL